MRKEVADAVSAKFIEILLRLQKHGGKAFLEELLTPTEQIMLAKRLAIIFMLIENRSYYRIIKNLKVSTSTSKRIHEAVLTGKFTTIEKAFARQKRKQNLLDQLEMLSRAGLPPHAGKRIWGVRKRKPVL